MIEPAMTVERAIEFAREWQQGLTIYPGAQCWRVVCMVLADAVEALRIDVQRVVEANEEYHRDALALEQERDELRRRVAELERYHVQAIAHRICGEIPERFHIEMVLENGAGCVSLFHDGKPVEIDMADWNIAEQFDVAMQCVVEYTNQIEGGV